MPTRYRPDELERFVREALLGFGMASTDAATSAAVVVDADRRGVGTHGVANFVWHAHYGPGLRDGYIKACPEIAVLRDAPVAAAWDADRGFGPLVAHGR